MKLDTKTPSATVTQLPARRRDDSLPGSGDTHRSTTAFAVPLPSDAPAGFARPRVVHTQEGVAPKATAEQLRTQLHQRRFEERLDQNLRHAAQLSTCAKHNHARGLRVGYVQGFAWGALCGAVGAAAIVVLFVHLGMKVGAL